MTIRIGFIGSPGKPGESIIKCDRTTPLGNPFPCSKNKEDVARAVKAYAQYLYGVSHKGMKPVDAAMQTQQPISPEWMRRNWSAAQVWSALEEIILSENSFLQCWCIKNPVVHDRVDKTVHDCHCRVIANYTILKRQELVTVAQTVIESIRGDRL